MEGQAGQVCGRGEAMEAGYPTQPPNSDTATATEATNNKK